MFRASLRASAFLVLLALLTAGPALAQTTGTIEGKVLERSGAPVPEAVIEVRSVSLQGRRIAISDADGRYRFPLLPPGNYTIAIERGSFETRQVDNIVVGLDRVVTVDVEMAPKVRAEIVVSAETKGVETAATNVGESLDQ